MPKFQLRRPSPLVLVPRQDQPRPGDAAKSPETPGDSPSPTGGPPSPDSPDSPSPKPTSFSLSTAAQPQASSAIAPAAGSSVIESKPPAASSNPPPPPVTSAASVPNLSSSISTSLPVPQSTVKLSSSQPTGGSQVPQSSQTSKTSQAAQSVIVSESSSSDSASSIVTITSAASQTQKAPAAQSTTSENNHFSEGQQNSDKPPLRKGSSNEEPPIISKGAEAGLIVLAVLGAIALIVGVILFMKRRRRRRQQQHLRHAEDAFSPSNSGSLHTPQTSHLTRSTTTTALFRGDDDQRPETVSTNQNNSQYQTPGKNIRPIQPPMASANPFADPPLNKAYDVLRGRPRSTTLTDRGSWTKNPFKDPVSERFDPFGELQEKARQERMRYYQAAAHEERKGSNVTVEGMGVLDRSGDGRR